MDIVVLDEAAAKARAKTRGLRTGMIIHVGQMDQQRAVEFYGKEVLPALRKRERS